MKIKLRLTIVLIGFLSLTKMQGQILYPQGGLISRLSYEVAKDIMPEYGFLSGKKFPTYSTIEKYDFKNIKLKVVFYDDRNTLQLRKINCSEIVLNNKSELNGEQGAVKVWEYINKLFLDSNIIIDIESKDVLEIHLTAFDCRLIGFGQIAVHGLSQMEFKYKGISKTYCTDIEDGDKNAPLSKISFVSRKTATRFMASASIRETIENFMKDFTDWKQ